MVSENDESFFVHVAIASAVCVCVGAQIMGTIHGDRIADAYFFSELFARYGEREAIDFLIASAEQNKCATMTRSRSTWSIGSASSGSQTSYAGTSPSILSSLNYGYLKSVRDRPCPLGSGSTSAASSKECDPSSEAHGRDSRESFERVERESFDRMHQTLGPRAGLLYTDAAHLIMDEGDDLSSDSL